MRNMDEFSLIERYFRSISPHREDVVIGNGDDAAGVCVPADRLLLISTDTLVADVHFKTDWDAYDIASRAVRINVSDIAAMAGQPVWMTLALTIPTVDQRWLERFSLGLKDQLHAYQIALIGGNIARGPLSITIAIHGLVPFNKAVTRYGAQAGDRIYLTGALGAASQAVALLEDDTVPVMDKSQLMQALLHPEPRLEWADMLQAYASAAIDISDGLLADLNHIAHASGLGACLMLDSVPIHPLVKHYQGENALDFAMTGGDDYELCFTVSEASERSLLQALTARGLTAYCIGLMESETGLRGQTNSGISASLKAKGYLHFRG